MRNSRADYRWVAVLLLALAFPRPAQADPIVITAGSFAYDFDLSPPIVIPFTLTGADSSFFGFYSGGGVVAQFPRFQGGPADLSTSLLVLPGFLPQTQVVNGISYQAILSGTVNLTTEPFVAPPRPSDGSPWSFSKPFTMTGQFAGTDPNVPSAPVLFSADVTGRGTTSFIMHGFVPITTGVIRYDLEAAPAPTPEPSTRLLLGSAVVGVVWRARSRKTPPSSSTRTLRPSVSPAASS